MNSGRKKEFDEGEALSAMTMVFWQKGYEGASYEDLVKGTGVQRYGLYSAFGDKRNAFMKCMEHYVDNMAAEATAPMRKAGAGLNEIKDYFSGMLAAHKSPNAWGCLACNTAADTMSVDDEELRLLIKRMYDNTLKSFRHALSGAKDKGELAENDNPDEIANMLLGVMIGAAVMAKGPVDKDVIEDFINKNLDTLGQ